MTWRPEGWDARELWGEQFGYTAAFTEADRSRIEFGADAMLEALKKRGEYGRHYNSHTCTSDWSWRVFIPDEANKQP